MSTVPTPGVLAPPEAVSEVLQASQPCEHWFGPDEEGNPRCQHCLEPGCKETGGAHSWIIHNDDGVPAGRCENCGEWKDE